MNPSNMNKNKQQQHLMKNESEEGGHGDVMEGYREAAKGHGVGEGEASSTDLHCKRREYCFTETDTQTLIHWKAMSHESCWVCTCVCVCVYLCVDIRWLATQAVCPPCASVSLSPPSSLPPSLSLSLSHTHTHNDTMIHLTKVCVCMWVSNLNRSLAHYTIVLLRSKQWWFSCFFPSHTKKHTHTHTVWVQNHMFLCTMVSNSTYI